MKKAGVPSTPSFSPSAASCATLARGKPLASLAWNCARSTPAACASASKVSPSFFSGMTASWNFQNASDPPTANTALAACEAGRACGCMASGKCFHTMRSCSGPYVFFSCWMVGSTRLQKTHSKSANSTTVTSAVGLPHTGSSGSIGTTAL